MALRLVALDWVPYTLQWGRQPDDPDPPRCELRYPTYREVAARIQRLARTPDDAPAYHEWLIRTSARDFRGLVGPDGQPVTTSEALWALAEAGAVRYELIDELVAAIEAQGLLTGAEKNGSGSVPGSLSSPAPTAGTA